MTTATGPSTREGKRIAARNATTHGLFARDVVLPQLGEDPQAYEVFLAELTSQLKPKNLLQQHYTEKIAAASWRLRRLHRWQAQLFEDMNMPEDEVLARLDRVMRHETTLHRQIDTSIKMLGRELPRLLAPNARQDALDYLGATEDYCARNPGTAYRVAMRERELLDQPLTPPGLDLGRLDNVTAEDHHTENGQNEPDTDLPPASVPGEGARPAATRRTPTPPTVGVGGLPVTKPRPFCQNEPPTPLSTLSPPRERVASLSEPGEGPSRVRTELGGLGLT